MIGASVCSGPYFPLRGRKAGAKVLKKNGKMEECKSEMLWKCVIYRLLT
jgi:hypothetical protein